MDENGQYQGREKILSVELSTKTQKVVTTVDCQKNALTLMSAKNHILYYMSTQKLEEKYFSETTTQEEKQEIEKTFSTELYRADVKEDENRLQMQLQNGFIQMADDEIGIYYNDFLGTGYMETRNLYHKDNADAETVTLKTPDEQGKFSCTSVGPQKMVFRYENGEEEMYDLKTFTKEPVIMNEEKGLLYPVKGGYFYDYPINNGRLGWKFLTEEEALKEESEGVIVQE